MYSLLESIYNGLVQTTWIEAIAVISGIVSVWYSRKENILVFPTGLLNTTIYIYLSFKGHLLGEASVNLYYTIMSLYGWYLWTRKNQTNQEFILQITNSNTKERIQQFLFFAGVYAIIYFADGSVDQEGIYKDDEFLYAEESSPNILNKGNQNNEVINASSGSGFAVSQDGYVITNNHVIAGAEDILVRVGEKEFKAEVVGADPYMDIAVLKMDTKDKFTTVKFLVVVSFCLLGHLATGVPDETKKTISKKKSEHQTLIISMVVVITS